MAAMLEKLERIEGLKVVGLSVYASQKAAIELYKSFGFQIAQTMQTPSYKGKEYLDQYRMEKALTYQGQK
jgi:ribosomal protein S18 acetylase RimI-like enzyme